jgi:sigma54-dependent transcription regulator
MQLLHAHYVHSLTPIITHTHTQVQAMATEVELFQSQILEYRMEIDRMSKELADAKRKLFEHRRTTQVGILCVSVCV